MNSADILARLPNAPLVTLVTGTALFSFLFAILRLHRRFGRKTQYALRIAYARWALMGYAVLSTILALFLAFGTAKGIVDFSQTIPGAILVAFSASAAVAGMSSIVGVKSKDQKQMVTITTWVYETIDPEIERLVIQEITATAMRLARKPDAFASLCEVGRCWVSINPQFDKSRNKHKLLAQIEEFRTAGESVFPKLVTFLLKDCDCDARWLESSVGESLYGIPPNHPAVADLRESLRGPEAR